MTLRRPDALKYLSLHGKDFDHSNIGRCTDIALKSIFPKLRNPYGYPSTRALCSGGVGFSGKPGSVILAGNVSGSVKNPFLYASALFKIVETVRRWKCGPELDSQLDRLPVVPNMDHIIQAMRVLRESDRSMDLFRWAKEQPWYSPDDVCYGLMFDRLNQIKDHDGMQVLLDEMIEDSREKGLSGFTSHNQVIQYLAGANELVGSFRCFQKVSNLGCEVDTQSHNSLMAMFLNNSLPLRALDVYESMKKGGCVLDGLTYELMIPCLAELGCLDVACKLFEEMKANGFRQSHAVFASLIDSMGKAGRLKTVMDLYMEMKDVGLSVPASIYISLIESFVKTESLNDSIRILDDMKKAGFKPNFGLYNMIIESHLKSGQLEIATSVFTDMEKAGFLPTPGAYSFLIEMHSASGKVDSAMNLYTSMIKRGLRPSHAACTSILPLLARKKLVDAAAKVTLSLKSMGFPIERIAGDILMVYIKDGSASAALRWLHFMASSRIKTNSFIIMQLFKLCMDHRLFKSAQPVLKLYVNSSANVDLILYTSILACLVRCRDEKDEGPIMSLLATTNHKAHAFLCGLFTGPDLRNQPVLPFVREFFQGIDYEIEAGSCRYFVNVLLNYLVIVGQMNRARCVWKVSYENGLYPGAVVFDQRVSWSLDARKLSVGGALVAVVHTLHRFRKRMLCYGDAPRRVKLVTGQTLKMVVAQMLRAVEAPFVVGDLVLRARGDHVFEWFKKPIVHLLLVNEIPSGPRLLMHKLNGRFPHSTPEIRCHQPKHKPPLMLERH